MIQTAELHPADRPSRREHGASAALGLDTCVRRDAAKLGVHRCERGRAGDDGARHSRAVQNEHRRRAHGIRREGLSSLQADLLTGGEDDLEVGGRSLADQVAHQQQKNGDRGLVVGTENGLPIAAHHAVVDDDSRRAFEWHRVQVRAEGERRTLAAPRHPRDEVTAGATSDRAAVVLFDRDARVAQKARHDVGHLAFFSRGRADAHQTNEEVEQLL